MNFFIKLLAIDRNPKYTLNMNLLFFLQENFIDLKFKGPKKKF
jgi:hypothetical protein